MPSPSEQSGSRLDRSAERLSAKLAESTTRRSFLGRVSAAMLAVAGGSAVAAAVKPDEADAFHFCGHIWTTGSCPSPFPPLARIDRKGRPLHPSTGRPVDNLGRLVNGSGYPVDASGARLRGPDGEPLPAAPRTRICEDWTREVKGLKDLRTQGSWFRCCGGQIRKLVDCCSFSRRRINGDASLTGYCWGGRRVYCVMYYDSGLKC
ncbi:MAG TPA: twin-arginine translocation signal domain-containing protein [Gaiellaceae bacterium]|nr:twin-arginine translocation signal domain-containing protein [Gaiellaceae bacterium]